MANTPFQDFLNILNPKENDPENVPQDLQGEELQPGGYTPAKYISENAPSNTFDNEEINEQELERLRKLSGNDDVYPQEVNQQRAEEIVQAQNQPEVSEIDKMKAEYLDKINKAEQERERLKLEALTNKNKAQDLKNIKEGTKNRLVAAEITNDKDNNYDATKDDYFSEEYEKTPQDNADLEALKKSYLEKLNTPIPAPMKLKDLEQNIEGINVPNEPKSQTSTNNETFNETENIIKKLQEQPNVEPKAKTNSIQDLYNQYINLKNQEDPNLKKAKYIDAGVDIGQALLNYANKMGAVKATKDSGSIINAPKLDMYKPNVLKQAQQERESKLKRLQDLISLRQKMLPKEAENKPIKLGNEIVERDPKTGEYKQVYKSDVPLKEESMKTKPIFDQRTGEVGILKTDKDGKSSYELVKPGRQETQLEKQPIIDVITQMSPELADKYDLNELDLGGLNRLSKQIQTAGSLKKGQSQGLYYEERAISEAKKRAEMVDDDAKKLQKELTKQQLPNMSLHLENINKVLSNYDMDLSDEGLTKGKNKDLPGIGTIEGRLPQSLLSTEGIELRQNIQNLSNALLRSTAGTAVTTSEEQRTLKALGQGEWFNTEKQVLNGLKILRDVANRSSKLVYGSDPEAADFLISNSGVKFPHQMLGDITEYKPQGKAAAMFSNFKKNAKLRDKQQTIADRYQKLAESKPSRSTKTEEKITVMKDGKSYKLPKRQLESALKQGYELVK